MTTIASKILKWQKRLFWSVVFVLLVFLGLYLFLLNQSIAYVVDRDQGQLDIARLETEVSVLTERFINLSEQIDMDLAKSLGFENAKDRIIFAERQTSPIAVVSLTTD
ncbi:MAG: hypothetical protein ACOCU8_00475 [Patescibacteria group bacterium]